ncbi:hypothetical protein LCGC14_2394240 [marine sediment metagenome]|uniref:Uncharacterized protein n=1 Tax=marine sediment metagenome TaxID=412755 RepID=A0A0F9ERQ5_9ZZZZ
MAEKIEIERHAIRSWIETIATGEFHYTRVLGLQGKLSPEEDTKLRKIIYEFCHEKEPICESVGRNDGYYVQIDNHAQPLDWQSVGSKIDSGLILPFDLRKYVFIYPDTTIVFAGSKSSGKSGALYRTVVLNMNRVRVELLTNLEGGLAMLKDRFDAMDIDIPTPAPFKVRFVTDHFHQFIKHPSTLYVIDYIDAPEGTDFYMIGAQVKKIDQKLQGLNSNAVIGLQKPVGRDTAFGGEGTLKAPTLYLAMDSNKLKIVDAKVPADKKVHPKNMQWTFQYDNEGTRFLNIVPYHGE